MGRYIVKRIISLIPVLFIVSIVIFLIVHLTPGDPASVILGQEATEAQKSELREQLGLNDPLLQQYVNWIGGVLTGDLGTSYFMKESVTDAIFSHVKPTLALAIWGEIIALCIALPLGIVAARYRGTFIDQSMMGISLLGLSVPVFISGLFLVLIFGVQLQWLPVAGYQPISAGITEHLKHLVLPAVSLGIIEAALIARMTRSSMLEVLNMDYIKTARAKGVKERNVIYRHALRNAFLPILTIIGQSFGFLVAGAVITETIFNIPGLGQLIVNSVARRDYAVIQGVVLFVTLAYVFINLIIDLLYGVIDPRVRLDRK